MSDPVLVEREGAVATITINRPDTLNALTVEVKNALLRAVGEVSADPDVRAVVLTGAGRGFCVGQDLREHAASLAEDTGGISTVREHYNPLLRRLTEMPKPVLAAVNGMAAGAGAGLAFACDFRIAADTAGFLMAFARVGLSADSGSSWTLPRLVGHARAVELLMLAEPVDAARALEIGLVHRVLPAADLRGGAAEFAARLAEGPTTAYGAIKEALVFAATHDLASSLEREAELQDRCGRTDDHREATTAFVNKTPVVFSGR